VEVILSIKSYNQIEMRSPLDLKPYWRNPRINDDTVEALVEYIPIIGFNVPIVVDKKGVIVKGHARYAAAIRLGLEKVPVIVSDNLDEVNKLDRIADNRVFEITKWSETELERLDILENNDELSAYVPGSYPKDEYEFVCPYCGAVVKVKI